MRVSSAIVCTWLRSVTLTLVCLDGRSSYILYQSSRVQPFCAKIDSTNEDLITKLLANPILMRDMIVAGGAVSSETDKGEDGPKQFAQAMAIYEKIQSASPSLLLGSRHGGCGGGA